MPQRNSSLEDNCIDTIDDVIKHPNTVIREIIIREDQFAQLQVYKVTVFGKGNFKQNKKEVLKECIQFPTQ